MYSNMALRFLNRSKSLVTTQINVGWHELDVISENHPGSPIMEARIFIISSVLGAGRLPVYDCAPQTGHF